MAGRLQLNSTTSHIDKLLASPAPGPAEPAGRSRELSVCLFVWPEAKFSLGEANLLLLVGAPLASWQLINQVAIRLPARRSARTFQLNETRPPPLGGDDSIT